MTLRQGDVLDSAFVTDLARGQDVLLSAVGPGHGGDQLIVDGQGQSRISAEDLAVAIVDEVEQPRHRRQQFTVAYQPRPGADRRTSERRIAMEVGDTVIVRATGRRARLVEDLGQQRYQVEFLPDPMTDPIDRDTVQSEDEGGVYSAGDLEPVP